MHIIFQDGSVTNVNYADAKLTDVKIPKDFLSKTYLARCPFDYKMACSAPEGEVTDFNIWDRALTETEAVDWTSCR